MTAPLTVLIDHRESAPYTFAGLATPPVVTHTTTLWVGDYSLPGFERQCIIERKSLADLYATLCDPVRREVFEWELEKLDDIAWPENTPAAGQAWVVVEDDWMTANPPRGYTERAAHQVVRLIAKYTDRCRVPWFACLSRRDAEARTLRLLQLFLQHHNSPITDKKR